MSRQMFLALLTAHWALPAHARGERHDAAVGLWWAEGGAAQVEIQPCGDAHARDGSMVGVEILRGLRPEGSGSGCSVAPRTGPA